MAKLEKAIIWYDPEGDFLEVSFDEREGEMVDTQDDRVMVKLADDGEIIGFHILNVGTMKGVKAKPFEVDLTSRRPARSTL